MLKIRAEDKFVVDLDNPIGIAYTLTDNETTVISIKGWITGKNSSDEDCIGVITSKDGPPHVHAIYRYNKDELDDDISAFDLAKHYFSEFSAGAQVLHEEKYQKKQIKNNMVVRKAARIEEDHDDDGKIEKLWVIVEAKEFKDRFYVQLVYHVEPVSKKKLNLIGKVMNSVTIKSEQDAAGNPLPAE